VNAVTERRHWNNTYWSAGSNYREQRGKLRKEVGAGKMKVERLLGNARTIKHMIEYIKATRRLES
jgi:hypothetical protein